MILKVSLVNTKPKFMRKIFLTLSFTLALLVNCWAQFPNQAPIDSNGAVLTLITKEVNYGTIKQNSDRFRTVQFTNSGKANLIIDTCLGSCGCTTPKCPQNMVIKPGEIQEFKVEYKTERLGKFNKTVTIRSNSTTGDVVINVKGEVLPEENALPQNSSGPVAN